jgi:hypothetical protein
MPRLRVHQLAAQRAAAQPTQQNELQRPSHHG